MVCSLVAALLGACNQVYDLGSTRVRDAFEPMVDGDDDGIADADDNCPTMANASQTDGDDDGKGDACDGCAFCAPCATGADHDEDGDKLADGCDNCPAYANAGQENADGDDLGDACDPGPAVHRRRFFDGFGTLSLSPDWLERGAPWGIANDAVAPMPGFGGGTAELRHRTVKVESGTAWFVEVGLDPVVPLVGVYLTAVSATWSCILIQGAEGVHVNNTGMIDPTDRVLTGPSHIRAGVAAGIGNQKLVCELGAFVVPSASEFVFAYPLDITLFGHEAARFTYVDVIGP